MIFKKPLLSHPVRIRSCIDLFGTGGVFLSAQGRTNLPLDAVPVEGIANRPVTLRSCSSNSQLTRPHKVPK